MAEKVICPYCGAEMKRGDYVVHVCYVCPECEAEGPLVTERYGETVEETWERAKQAAMRRADPLNRLLTLEEVYGSEEPCVYLEIVRQKPIWAVDCVIAPDCKGVAISFIHTAKHAKYTFESYKQDWRCWFRKPTEEERQNTPWEEAI